MSAGKFSIDQIKQKVVDDRVSTVYARETRSAQIQATARQSSKESEGHELFACSLHPRGQW